MANLTTGGRRPHSILFLGSGSMAEAVVRGILAKELFIAPAVRLLNRSNTERLKQLHQEYGVAVPKPGQDLKAWIREADIVVLAMKPKDAEEALLAYRDAFRDDQWLLSVVAGLSIASMERLIGRTASIARTMPNTSCTIGLGAIGVSFSLSASREMKAFVQELLGAVGLCQEVEEPLLDAVTGVSGSGPAYLYAVMEAMIAAGVREGLEHSVSRELTVQTVLGAAEMVRRTGEDPAVLRQKVTSPNGTTHAALTYMFEAGLPDIIQEAVHRASARATEIGAEIGLSLENRTND